MAAMGDGLAPATAAAPLRLPVGDNGWLIIVDDGLLLPGPSPAPCQLVNRVGWPAASCPLPCSSPRPRLESSSWLTPKRPRPANTAADKSSRSSCASFLAGNQPYDSPPPFSNLISPPLLHPAFVSVTRPRPPAEKSCKQQHIPFYDILWAELAARTLHLHYAHRPSTTMIRPQEWLCELSEADEDSEAIAPEAFVQALLSRAYGAAQPRKRALVLVNPHSGTGDAVFKWNRHVRPLLEAARLHLDPVILERGGEATELAEKVDIDRYDTIVACSGDGTPHEIFNGLARRPDAHTALSKIAVSQIPCGSGNAMACNLYGSHHPTHAALAIIKGVVTPMDLISITQADRRIISFLSQSLGLIAESDLGTESLRWMGEARFVIGILTRVFRQRCYPCDLAVKVEVADKEDVRQHYRRHTAAASSRRSAPLRRRREGDSGIGSDSGSGGGVSSRSNGSMSSNGNMGDANAGDAESNGPGLPDLKYGTIRDELPDGWELIPHDKIGNFYCGNVGFWKIYPFFFFVSFFFFFLPRLSGLTQRNGWRRWPSWRPMSTSSRPPSPRTAAWT